MAVTEIAQMSLKPGVDIKVAGEGKEMLEFVCETIASQEGCLSVHYGMHVENPDKLDMIIEWVDEDAHKKFVAKDDYKSFVERASALLTGEPGSLVIDHANFPDRVGDALATPATEVLLLYVPLEAGAEVVTGMDHLLDVGMQNKAAVSAYTYGWVVEELEAPELFEGKAKGYRALFGWESVEKHEEYRQTKAFEESVVPLIKLGKGHSVHHTVFTKYEKA